MRKLMAVLAVSAVMAVLGGCAKSGSSAPPPSIPYSIESSAPSSTAAQSSSAPVPASTPTTFDAATIAQLGDEAAFVKQLNDQAFANRQPLSGKDATRCEAQAYKYNDTVKRLHLTADQLGGQLLPPSLACETK